MQNLFVEAVKESNVGARTANDMKARKTTSDANVDLFYKIGASRGKNILPDFIEAFNESPELALRIALWSRDIRGGAGERKIFRDILSWLDVNSPDWAGALLEKVPELGRWDDLLMDFTNPYVKNYALALIRSALRSDNPGLVAKWMPRKGLKAVELRSFLGLSPKKYRKTLVNATNVVEQKMCAREWDDINYSHVPSVASARYKKAFGRHSAKYAEYIQKLVKGDKTVKVNAEAIFPYDVLKGVVSGRYFNPSQQDLDHITAQWNALPNYVGDANVLAMVDVSGSMTTSVIRGGKLTPIEIAVGLGLYVADKNRGAFKDTFLTFSNTPELLHLKGNILQKIAQMVSSKWMMNTNLHAAIELILSTAVRNRVPASHMPKMLLILSDMQFDRCARYDDSAIQMIARKFESSGYEMPRIVFWNLNAYENVPVKFDTHGVALVSGFSPAIVKSLLSGNLDDFTPEAIMLKTVMKDRYAL